jgi:hypothetical protein
MLGSGREYMLALGTQRGRRAGRLGCAFVGVQEQRQELLDIQSVGPGDPPVAVLCPIFELHIQRATERAFHLRALNLRPCAAANPLVPFVVVLDSEMKQPTVGKYDHRSRRVVDVPAHRVLDHSRSPLHASHIEYLLAILEKLAKRGPDFRDQAGGYSFGNQLQADIAKGALEAAGIDAMIQSDSVGGMRPHVAWGGSGFKVLVCQEDAADARKVLEPREENTA